MKKLFMFLFTVVVTSSLTCSVASQTSHRYDSPLADPGATSAGINSQDVGPNSGTGTRSTVK